MKQRSFQENIVKLAAQMPPDDRVPYAFEKRIMASLPLGNALDVAAMWGRLLWKSVIPCVAVMLLTTAIAFSTEGESPDLEATVLAPVVVQADLDNW